MGLFRKKIKDCKVLERYRINIDYLLSNGDDSIKRIGENEKYCFYDYNESGSHFILRQSKEKRKEVVSLDYASCYNVFCLWDKYLVMAKSGAAELGRWDGFIFIDVETGERQNIGLRSDYGNMVFINGYGRQYNQDVIKRMYVKDDILVIEFKRKKYTQKDADKVPYNEDMEYTLYLRYIDGELSAHRSYEDEKEDSNNNETNIDVNIKDWGKGIPEYSEEDLMTEEELLDFAMQIVKQFELDKNNFELISANNKLGIYPNFVAKKNGELYFILVKADIAPRMPELTEEEKNTMLKHSKELNAIPLFAPVGFGSTDSERFDKSLALRGDGFYSNYIGLEEIK